MWVPPEDKDPTVLQAPTRRSVAMFGAVNLRTGQLITQLAPTFGAQTFRIFLGRLLRHRSRSRRMVVVLDNARYHRACLLNDFLRSHRLRMRLDFLPPYSPELAPIERVWKLLRRLATHNQYFPELEDLLHAVMGQAEMWVKPNDVLARLCCII